MKCNLIKKKKKQQQKNNKNECSVCVINFVHYYFYNTWHITFSLQAYDRIIISGGGGDGGGGVTVRRLPSQWPQFETVFQHFMASQCFCAWYHRILSMRSRDIFIVFFADPNLYFRPKCDLLLALTKLSLCRARTENSHNVKLKM